METSKGTALGVVAVAIAAIALFATVAAFQSHSSSNVGGERAGLQEYIDGIKSGDINSKWVSKKLPPLANSVKLYCNTSGHDIEADYGSIVVPTGDTASSTTNGSLFATTTTTSIPATQDWSALAEGKRALIQTAPMATSTTATTTSSVYAASVKLGNGAVLVANNSCLWGYLQQNTTACSIAGAVSGAACETATSSNRGTNPIFSVRVRSIDAGKPTL